MKGIFLKASATVSVFVFIFLFINPSELAKTISNVNVGVFLVSLFIIPAGFTVKALKFRYILKRIGIEITFFRSLRISLIGTFYSLFTPGKIGELIKVYHIKSEKSKTIPSVIFDKLTDLLALFGLCLLSVAVIISDLFIILAFILFSVLIPVGLLLLLNERMINLLGRILNVSDLSKKEFNSNMNRLIRSRGIMVRSLLFSYVFYLTAFLSSFVLIISLEPAINPFLILSFPLIVLFGNLPVTISGLGMREFVASTYFSYFGYSPLVGFAFSILWFIIITLIPGLIGYFFLLTEKQHAININK